MGSIRSVFTWVLLGVLVALSSPIGGADAPKQDSLTAKQILDRMAEAYAGCKSYRDSGIVKTVFVRASGDDTKENTFATAFVRPDRFRFGCKRLTDRLNREQRYIVWCKGKEVQTWWNIKSDIEQQPSLGKALVGATGVSGGSAHTVPALLFPEEIGGRRLTDLKDAKRASSASMPPSSTTLHVFASKAATALSPSRFGLRRRRSSFGRSIHKRSLPTAAWKQQRRIIPSSTVRFPTRCWNSIRPRRSAR